MAPRGRDMRGSSLGRPFLDLSLDSLVSFVGLSLDLSFVGPSFVGPSFVGLSFVGRPLGPPLRRVG